MIKNLLRRLFLLPPVERRPKLTRKYLVARITHVDGENR